MRIIAGLWRGRALVAPEGAATRPTSDRTREALFSMLTSRLGSLEGLKVADICAGTGALGLEALSRGAAHCTFVERDRAAVDALRTNIAKMGAEAEVRAIAAESFVGGSYDLVLIDPPYGSGLAQKVLPKVGIAPGGWVSVETAKGEAVTIPGFEAVVERVHGKAMLTLLRAKA
ncbi:16S rRNA (guanine(966)-N(2))-methyltransferase RsmD [Sphingomonas montanisoli]|uniref:16S rRNA (Guanine(966)-N(2))-methyltransferase RsmD n=1 Tax=Sphingomonas montanisoli TaxID=2606412 RepID=A0A5D9C8D8_9SPHN|nr:16S rRNA (guanine(966)-N(2))-methyltransferase RsmD [Sphingomonas montanisoli]TZG26291.1 16S rRNA (guanine(966)-N(2))-methyltransferase RsmD [Sphingomonas montanisoli]